MSALKRNVLFSLALAGSYFLLFILHFLAASFLPSDAAVRVIGYAADVCLSVGLALGGFALLFALGDGSTVRERFLLPALPFLARLLYYVPYHTLDFTLRADMLSIEAFMLSLVLALVQAALAYGGYLALYYLYRRLSDESPDVQTMRLLSCALPLSLSLLSILGALVSGLFDVASLLVGGVLLGYLLELLIALLSAGASYALLYFLQEKRDAQSAP